MLADICVAVFLWGAAEINVLVFGWSRGLSSHRGRGCFSGNVIPASSLLLPARREGGESGEGGGRAGQHQPETLNFYGSKRDKACPESGQAGRDPSRSPEVVLQGRRSVISWVGESAGFGRPWRPRKAFLPKKGVWLRPPLPIPLACFFTICFCGFPAGHAAPGT